MAWRQNELEHVLATLKDTGLAEIAVPGGGCQVLGPDDQPVIERALQALQNNEVAWLGFKRVLDADACVKPTGDERFPTGSATAEPFVYFANAEGELVCGHDYNDRDRFQMLDVTRGPSMHTDQFAGLDWVSAPLKARVRVVIFGACEVARHLANFCHAVDFDTAVLDCDPTFLNEERFPTSQLVFVDFNALDPALVGPDDFACVLTRNHTYDVEALACALQANPAYVGMIGHPDKIKNNYETLKAQGASDEAIARVHAPIGIKCGGRTPAEIAVSIVAQLIQERRG